MRRFNILLLLSLILAPNFCFAQSKGNAAFYFANVTDPEYGSCGSNFEKPVYRNLNEVKPYYVLEDILAGPTPEEIKQGYRNTFKHNSFVPDAKPLIEYYEKLEITKDGTAQVYFKQGAMAYLNHTVCIQESVKTPIEKTLKQFRSIKKIEYMIDGKLVNEWDG